MPNDDWKDSCHSWSSAGSFAHPDSSAGGCGPGVSRTPGPCGNKGPVSSAVPHPASPSGNLYAWNQNLPGMVFDERVNAVYQALRLAPDYIPKAIYDATGQELYTIVRGIVPGLVFFIGVLAASTTLGAIVGGLIGALAFGVGAAPGAAAGASVGLDLGLALLDYLGIAFLAAYIGKSLLKAAEVSKDAIKVAWNSVDHTDPKQVAVHLAAERLAYAVGLVFRGVLQGVVAFLLAKGTAAAARRVPELVAKFRTSKLGAGFAEWIERNWTSLIRNKELQPEQTSTPTGEQTGGSSGSQQTSPPPKKQPPPPADEPPASSVPADGPGSPKHKAQRWAEYQERTPPDKRWSYDRWSKTYDLNMKRAIDANKAVDAYHAEIGGWGEREVTVDVEGVPRRLDIADPADLRGIEYKTGDQYLSQDNLWEITRDEILVNDGWEIDWVFEHEPSGPLRSALEDAGINVIVR